MNEVIYERIKKEVCEEARKMRQINRMVPVSGTRYDLPLDNREINIVYYKCGKEHAPLILGFHGGGFLFGGSALNDAMWKTVAEVMEMDVASVEYRKSPDFTWQASLWDAYDTAIYMRAHAEEFGFDAAHISVMGCSAGANIAATVCIFAKNMGEIVFDNQFLMYPYVDRTRKSGDIMMNIFDDLHCPEVGMRRLSFVSPIFASQKERTGLPNCVIVVAEKDDLNAEGVRYGQLLMDAGVNVNMMQCDGMPHIFFEMGFGQPREEELANQEPLLREVVESGAAHEASVEALAFFAAHKKEI